MRTNFKNKKQHDSFYAKSFNDIRMYNAYLDDLKSAYPDETFETANPLNVPDYVWDHILEHALYGKKIQGKYERNSPVDVIHVKSIKEEPDLLKMAPLSGVKYLKEN